MSHFLLLFQIHLQSYGTKREGRKSSTSSKRDMLTFWNSQVLSALCSLLSWNSIYACIVPVHVYYREAGVCSLSHWWIHVNTDGAISGDYGWWDHRTVTLGSIVVSWGCLVAWPCFEIWGQREFRPIWHIARWWQWIFHHVWRPPLQWYRSPYAENIWRLAIYRTVLMRRSTRPAYEVLCAWISQLWLVHVCQQGIFFHQATVQPLPSSLPPVLGSTLNVEQTLCVQLLMHPFPILEPTTVFLFWIRLVLS